MNSEHPIKKKQGPIPHDPRNEPLPETKKENGSRSAEEAERKARKEEGVDMKGQKGELSTGTNQQDDLVVEDEYGMPTGIHSGRTMEPEAVNPQL